MNKILKYCLLVLSIIIALTAAFVFSFLDLLDCDETIYYKVDSPDKTYTAKSLERLCGVMTGGAVVQLSESKWFAKNYDVMIADHDKPSQIKWLDNRTLKIDLYRPLEPDELDDKRVEKWQDVKIVYEVIPKAKEKQLKGK
jgi:hypothetical protein